MKQISILFSSLCLMTMPVVPAQASLVADTNAADTMTCLKLLFTDSEAHAAECGGPFEMDTTKDPLVKGTYNPGCHVVEISPLMPLGTEWRVQVAEITCCYSELTPSDMQVHLTPGELFRIRVAGC